jgi:hypothetical protein
MTDEAGIYRPSAHLEAVTRAGLERIGGDPEAHVRSHVRRLEALRRAGHVERIEADGWKIPADITERGVTYEARNRGRDFFVRIVMFGSNPGWPDRPEYTRGSAPKGDDFEANQRAAFLAPGLAPSNDGRPRVSRRWATEPFPKSGKLSNASPDISRSSPTVFMPGANSAFYIRVGLGGSVCHPEAPVSVQARSFCRLQRKPECDR